MAKTLLSTGDAVLAHPVTAPVLGASQHSIGFAEAMAAIRDVMDLFVPEGHGWHIALGQTAAGTCFEVIEQVDPQTGATSAIPQLAAEVWA